MKTTPDVMPCLRPGVRTALALALAAALPVSLAHADAAPAGAAAASAGSPAANATAAAAAAAAAQAAQYAASVAGSTMGGSASAPAAPNAASDASRELRFGGRAALFRRLIPSPMLEAQAAAEYAEIVRGAAHSDRLYPPADARVQRVQTIVDRLAPYTLKWSDRVKNWKWEVAVIRSPDIRMYCLPGGKIVVYGGLLDKVKLNDNELGMLFGHEIAHAVREHVRERLGEQQAAQLQQGSVPQLFGLADLGVFPLGIGSQLFEMHYGRADETEADVIGSDIASRAGFDPRAAVTLWDKLAGATRSDRDQGFIYVHPYTAARRDDLLKRLPDMLSLYAKALGMPLAALPDYQGMGVPQRRRPAADTERVAQ
ncbi:MAG TPA: M48 family metallopeptidase [Paraburkholderia sp.]|nr:M48 family metallopeptidase [Paraburkholderia sp.]